MKSNALLAYAGAFLVTILWSSSYVLIKYGLNEIPPFLFAAVRYFLAFVFLGGVLLGFGTSDSREQTKMHAARLSWSLLIAGISGYTLAQGLQYVGLFYLPAVTTSFILNFTPIFVLLLGIPFLGEKASKLQVAGIAVALLGSFAFFQGRLTFALERLGFLIVVIAALSWAVYLVMIRKIQRCGSIGSLKLTTVTMGIGTAGLVISAAALGEVRAISINGLLIILWLSMVNTAAAFFLWNHALRYVRAYELSVIQTSMLIEIAVLAWLFLGEQLSSSMVAGVALVIFGILLVQIPAIKRGERMASIYRT